MGGSNIPIILSICQTPNCFLILRFNSSPSSISFWSQRTFLPPKCTSQLNRNFVVPSLQQSWCLDSFSKAECWCSTRTHTLKIDRFDVKIPTLIIRVFFVGQKQFVAVDWNCDKDCSTTAANWPKKCWIIANLAAEDFPCTLWQKTLFWAIKFKSVHQRQKMNEYLSVLCSSLLGWTPHKIWVGD